MKIFFFIVIIFFNTSLASAQDNKLEGKWDLVHGSVTSFIEKGYVITQVKSFNTREHVYHMRTNEKEIMDQKERLICIVTLKSKFGTTECYLENK